MGASGTATLNFGAFPGSSHTTVDVVAAGVIVTSLIEAWILPVATADHSVDEHLVETLKVSAVYVSDGNLRIHGFNTNQVIPPPKAGGQFQRGSAPPMWTYSRPPAPMLYGQWSVTWVWN